MPYVDTLRYPLAERLRSGEPLVEALDIRQDLARTDQSGQTRSPMPNVWQVFQFSVLVGVRVHEPGVRRSPYQFIIPVGKQGCSHLIVLACPCLCTTIRVILGDWL